MFFFVFHLDTVVNPRGDPVVGTVGAGHALPFETLFFLPELLVDVIKSNAVVVVPSFF
jgi:hypothetical protein